MWNELFDACTQVVSGSVHIRPRAALPRADQLEDLFGDVSIHTLGARGCTQDLERGLTAGELARDIPQPRLHPRSFARARRNVALLAPDRAQLVFGGTPGAASLTNRKLIRSSPGTTTVTVSSLSAVSTVRPPRRARAASGATDATCTLM